MYISKIEINNFRLLKEVSVDLKEDLSLLIGKNNTGKTSFLILFDKFYNKSKFSYNDFSLEVRPEILSIDKNTNVYDSAIRMIIEIDYSKADSLANISEFFLDLSPEIHKTRILFEATINKKNLLRYLENVEEEEEGQEENRIRHLKKYLRNFIDTNIYVIDETEIDNQSRKGFVKKDLESFKKVINFQMIHARRDVLSSEANDGHVLSKLTTHFFNSQKITSPNNFSSINNQIVKIDKNLDKEYQKVFGSYLEIARDFLKMEDLKVVSNLESNELISNNSKVVYGHGENYLPEHLNGLGYMNILFVLLSIEIKKANFEKDSKDINLLFLEEPEAHTHPQMQYIFANKITDILKNINHLQTVVSTHSSYIVSQQEKIFESIRYFMQAPDKRITIKNFHSELAKNYEKDKEFKFLKQYLTIQASELFFADVIIFIEGTTERLLLPYFIKRFDDEQAKLDEDYIRLSSQNVSILEVGENGKVFKEFLEFLGVKTLIITDIDTTEKCISAKEKYTACSVEKGTHISNETIKIFYAAPNVKEKGAFAEWMKKLKEEKLHTHESLRIAYQSEQNGYHARSFEDAFISVNFATIKNNRYKILGLKNREKITDSVAKSGEYYELTKSIISKKSVFASSLLYLALTDDEIEWEIPQYIKNGLLWLKN